MKAVFFYALTTCIAVSLIATVSPVHAQQKDTSMQEMSNRINTRNFIFKAQTASPQTGGLIQLNHPYDITISGNTIISYLPYYGRAFTTPINAQDAGIEFTNTNFTYEVEKEDEDEWSVTIKTKGLHNYKLLFTIYDNGQAQLQVSSSNRQPIRFDGYIAERLLNKSY